MKFICEAGNDKFYLMKDVKQQNIIFSITDLKSLWQVSMSEVETVDRFKALNPLVQANPEWIVTYVRSSLDPDKSTFGLSVEDTRLTLNVHSKLDIKARMGFILDVQDNQKFFKLVTNPMVAVIAQLMDQRTKLLDLVKSKDLELREYKLEGAEISRKNVETDEIIEKAFVKETTEEFTCRIRKEQRVPELKLSSDLVEIFSETINLKEDAEVTKTEPEGSTVGDLVESRRTLQVKAVKRPVGNQTIIQVPRAKEKKKNFKL